MLKDAVKKQQGVAGMLDFAEEWASDSAYTTVANTWVRLMTGVDGVKYVSETSAFISDWVNAISQVFYGDQYFPKQFAHKDPDTKKTKVDKIFKIFNKSYRTMDFVNPVNVEAAIRLIEEAPVIGDGASWLHEKTDKLIESTIGSWGNTLASKGILGYHIGKNVKSI